MAILRCAFLVLLANSVGLSQTARPAEAKPQQPAKVTPKPEVIEQILQAGKIDWTIIAPEDVQDRFRVRPRVWIEPVQPELIIDWQRPVMNPRFKSETDFKPFVENQIAVMAKKFNLSEQTIRKLRLAAKGVAHRTKRRSKPKKRDPNEPIVLVLGIQPPPRDLSAAFRSRLVNSKLWNTTLCRVLTKKQQAEWRAIATTKTPNLSPPTLPAVIVLPDTK